MAGFKGQAEYSVDAKGRVAIPAKMRNALHPSAKNTFTVTRGFEQCIFVYPFDRWEEMEATFSELNMFRGQSRDFIRLMMMWADEATVDGQGRIGLPRALTEFAEIQDRALIIGALDRIEIWNPETFAAHIESQVSDYEKLAEQVMGGNGQP